ncbi:MAG TPA: alanine racemase [Xanthomonadaceae bacterium]|nr:alanine racemase [Xanthomonadaceae bacterium]
MSRGTQAIVHLQALRHNLGVVRAHAAASKVMAVVKADGYGHGLERVARVLADGADAFGVAYTEDARRLRDIGLDHRIVLLSGVIDPDDLAEVRRLDAEIVVHDPGQLALLECNGASKPLKVWLKIDTGMHRLGFDPAEARAVHARLRALPHVDPDIVLMTHFASSDVAGDPRTRAQQALFQRTVDALPGARTLANSAALLGWPDSHADWVRAGGLLYGISVIEGRTGSDLGLHPAMTLRSRLIAVKRVARGERVGYGGDFVCPDDMRIGVVAIGYGDGYPRHVAGGTQVLVNGQPAGIVGRVSMDLVSVDLRGQPEARVGDPVVLWGRGLPVETIAAQAGTIGYELTCGMTRRVRFVEDDQPLD